MRAKFLLMAATAATCVHSFAVAGDWTVTILEVQEEQGFPRVNSVWGDRQAGSIDPGLQQPMIWLGAPGTGFQAVQPPSSSGVQINALTQTTAVGDGYVSDLGGYVVFVWNQDGTSFNVIQPPSGFIAAFATGAGGNQQVGSVEDFNIGRMEPALWMGSTESFVSLLPTGFESGRASSTDGVQQVGEVQAAPEYFDNAALWSGSAASFINLHPGGPWLFSGAYGVSQGVQVGYVSDDNSSYAVGWHGTAASMFFLHPFHVPSAIGSEATSIDGTVVCGSTEVMGAEFTEDRAAVWTSLDPMSYVNLHELLGPGYYQSEATDVWVGDDGVIKVVGNASLDVTFQDVAVLWTLDTRGSTCASCPADYDDNGGVDGGDLAAFFTDFEAGEGCADVDANGGVDGGDLAFFFELFEAGGC